MIKRFTLIFFLIITAACDFKPIFSEKNFKSYNFSISKLDLTGERLINIAFKSKLKNYTEKEAENSYEVRIRSKILREIESKDAKGNAASYKLSLLTTVLVLNDDKNITEKKYQETFEYLTSDNKFELKQYENRIKNNLAENTINEAILDITRLKDNAN